MINLFSFTGKRVGVNILRSSYLTYKAEQKRLTVKDKKQLAILMRTRNERIDDHYIKILPQVDKKIILNEMEGANINLAQKISPYQKQLISNKHYQKNKETIISRVKEYIKQIPTDEINKNRIPYYLNGDENIKKRSNRIHYITFNVLMVYGFNIFIKNR